MQHPTRKVGARGHQKRGVVKPRRLLIVRLGGGILLKLQQCSAASAQSGHFAVFTQNSQSDRICIVGDETLQIAHLHPNRTDVQRSLAREGWNGRWIGSVHGTLYWLLP